MASIRKQKKVLKAKRERNGAAFEKLVAVIETVLRPGDIVKHNTKKAEDCGLIRQIDVEIEGKNIIIECKDYKKTSRVTVGEMGEFVDRCKSTNSTGIYVSKSGFQSGAIQKANFNNIKMYTVSQVETLDFRSNFPKTEIRGDKFEYSMVHIGISTVGEDTPIEVNEIDESKFYLKDKSKVFSVESIIKQMEDKLLRDFWTESLKQRVNKDFEPNFDKLFQTTERVKISNEEIYFYKGGSFMQLLSVDYTFRFIFKTKEISTSHFVQKDLENNAISEVLRGSFEFKDKLTRVDLVSKVGTDTYEAFEVPINGDSEIIKIKSYGKINLDK